MNKHTGRSTYRFKQNPREKLFADHWKKANDPDRRQGVLDFLLAEDSNHPRGEVTDRDAEVAATVIQWLGSPVGQWFLRDVHEAYDGEKES